MAVVRIPAKLVPVFAGEARYRVAYGGRGSGKTRTFAKMAAIRAAEAAASGRHGLVVCGREFANSLDESSFSEVRSAIESEPWLQPYFDVGEKYIRTADRRIEFDFVGLRRNVGSLTSKANILLMWVDEAEPVPESSWEIITPTVRLPGSEIWVTYNPRRPQSATNRRFRLDPPDSYRSALVNWRDNPWFPDVLELERQNDKVNRPDQYDHIWEGDYRRVSEGAYYADCISAMRSEGRLTDVRYLPTQHLRAYWDLGYSDHTVVIVAQFVGEEIRVLDHIEGKRQPPAYYFNELRRRGYGNAECILPHDGSAVHPDNPASLSYEDQCRSAGFSARVVRNQGRGAAMARIDVARTLFPRVVMNEATTGPLVQALGEYHEKIDDSRGVGLGPVHDDSSHSADAFGLMCVDYDLPSVVSKREFRPNNYGIV